MAVNEYGNLEKSMKRYVMIDLEQGEIKIFESEEEFRCKLEALCDGELNVTDDFVFLSGDNIKNLAVGVERKIHITMEEENE